jgi:hypothetical protein
MMVIVKGKIGATLMTKAAAKLSSIILALSVARLSPPGAQSMALQHFELTRTQVE